MSDPTTKTTPQWPVITIILVIAAAVILYFAVTKNRSERSKVTSNDDFLDSLIIARRVDSSVKALMHNAMFDTVGLHAAPVKVISAKLIKKEYSNYRDISLSFKNVSSKTITAIRFKWYGTNAFNEPADMGTGLIEGFGGGFTDETLRPGKIGSGTWGILSRDGKKVVLAWAYEVAFNDGTNWKLKN